MLRRREAPVGERRAEVHVRRVGEVLPHHSLTDGASLNRVGPAVSPRMHWID